MAEWYAGLWCIWVPKWENFMDCLGLLEHVCTDVKVLRNWSSSSKGGVFLSGVVQLFFAILLPCCVICWSRRGLESEECGFPPWRGGKGRGGVGTVYLLHFFLEENRAVVPCQEACKFPTLFKGQVSDEWRGWCRHLEIILFRKHFGKGEKTVWMLKRRGIKEGSMRHERKGKRRKRKVSKGGEKGRERRRRNHCK